MALLELTLGWIKSFWLCVQFFTRLPTPQYASVSAVEMGRSLAWFPVVGALIGLGLVGVAQLNQFLPATVTAVLVLAFWVWVTGALHLDGLADTADGWLGGVGNHQRALEIMKDSRIGTGGGVALGIALLLKWAVLVEVIQYADGVGKAVEQTVGQAVGGENLFGGLFVLWLAPVLARMASLVYIKTTAYVSAEGMGEQMFSFLSPYWVWGWAILACSILFVSGWFLLLVPVGLWVRWGAKRITGGMTGDTAGAMTEVIEITVMLIGLKVLG